MYKHHAETIQRVSDYFKNEAGVEALLLGGSIAHGFAQESSDVDVMIVVSAAEYERRRAQHDLTFFNTELCTYPDSYIDGKYIDEAFLSEVERRGSEPARFAFADSQVLFSQIDGLEQQLQRIARYPVEHKANRISRFWAQLQAWHWYVSEADKKHNDYLMGVAISKLLLFGGRMVLAHNELLYPYHKWFLNVLARAEDRPERLLETIQTLSRQPTLAGATEFYNMISGFREWETDGTPWPNHFMLDSELTWLHGTSAVDDL